MKLSLGKQTNPGAKQVYRPAQGYGRRSCRALGASTARHFWSADQGDARWQAHPAAREDRARRRSPGSRLGATARVGAEVACSNCAADSYVGPAAAPDATGRQVASLRLDQPAVYAAVINSVSRRAADDAGSHLVHHVGQRHPTIDVDDDHRAAPSAPEAQPAVVGKVREACRVAAGRSRCRTSGVRRARGRCRRLGRRRWCRSSSATAA